MILTTSTKEKQKKFVSFENTRATLGAFFSTSWPSILIIPLIEESKSYSSNCILMNSRFERVYHGKWDIYRGMRKCLKINREKE
ncbi:hypothetical protein WN55_04451 [Dufourea novaeangliae]|uniref:Uncharacterized protein n=1 Tax=Dufourea novaeangliae TaxID=178035 RepID=A0A154PM53_DUFNO|nr:hypothetical protein WN55_04451 [Dufourea novaeangliae]